MVPRQQLCARPPVLPSSILPSIVQRASGGRTGGLSSIFLSLLPSFLCSLVPLSLSYLESVTGASRRVWFVFARGVHRFLTQVTLTRWLEKC